jgi:DNA-binding CsgD family transcriptional regulator
MMERKTKPTWNERRLANYNAVISYVAANPNASNTQVARACRISERTVYGIRGAAKLKPEVKAYTKANIIFSYIAENPSASNDEVATATNSTLGYVHLIRRERGLPSAPPAMTKRVADVVATLKENPSMPLRKVGELHGISGEAVRRTAVRYSVARTRTRRKSSKESCDIVH